MPSKVMACGCAHPQQDRLHGPQRRVFNNTKKSEGKIWRCTACGAEKESGKPGEAAK